MIYRHLFWPEETFDTVHTYLVLQSRLAYHTGRNSLVKDAQASQLYCWNVHWPSAHMHEGYGKSFCVCVCVSVCLYHTNCYIPHLYVEIKVALSFLCHFLHMYCVDFIENTLFRSYGDICWPPLPSLLFDRLSMNKTDSVGLFSRWLVCRFSDRSYNSNGRSLVTVNCQLSFLTWAS